VHTYVLENLTEFKPVFGPHPGVSTTGREAGGQAVFEMTPYCAAGFFLFAEKLTQNVSPTSKLTAEQ